MLTKCAKLISCEESGNKQFVVYNAKACDGDERFSFFTKMEEDENEGELPSTCPVGSLVDVYYNPEYCLEENHSCYAEYMQFSADDHCKADCGVF
ncbi:hypothetical protein Wcon_00980 [Wolbachia endosymbiont of Cylisticus convexus]|uniref:hypothetical protein n=1 Tax=Wolbachia endosymbiont of Cylisticus convexus TaxID=118728 RepID=UPI000DF6B5CD|nr:hypothetical protein [Wolbachia endosymbiont of Cylisticus convexus]RDD34896.1 hypothetical protein Wcon_00980 [Wolbachia endosymbiont of Cylisticus convexus]